MSIYVPSRVVRDLGDDNKDYEDENMIVVRRFRKSSRNNKEYGFQWSKQETIDSSEKVWYNCKYTNYYLNNYNKSSTRPKELIV